MRLTTRDVSELFSAVSDTNRLRIVKCLQVRPACVCELVQALDLPQPRISRHLKWLRDAGLVVDARDAQWVEYSLVEAPEGSPEAQLLELLAGWLGDDATVAADIKRLHAATREQPVLS